MVVASLLDGRVRVRDEGLRREPLVNRVREALLALPGVDAVEANPRVGSLLIIYSAALTAVEKILKTVSNLVGSEEEGRDSAEPAPGREKTPFAEKASSATARVRRQLLSLVGRAALAVPPATKKRLVNIGMLASLALSLAAAIFGFKKLHVLAGIVFVVLFGDHFYQKKEAMFA